MLWIVVYGAHLITMSKQAQDRLYDLGYIKYYHVCLGSSWTYYLPIKIVMVETSALLLVPNRGQTVLLILRSRNKSFWSEPCL